MKSGANRQRITILHIPWSSSIGNLVASFHRFCHSLPLFIRYIKVFTVRVVQPSSMEKEAFIRTCQYFHSKQQCMVYNWHTPSAGRRSQSKGCFLMSTIFVVFKNLMCCWYFRNVIKLMNFTWKQFETYWKFESTIYFSIVIYRNWNNNLINCCLCKLQYWSTDTMYCSITYKQCTVVIKDDRGKFWNTVIFLIK